MATVATREAYFETGLDVLSDLGYGGLKLAEVCRRLGVTTGSFYHYFENWSAYTRELIEHWMKESNQVLVNQLRNEPDPRRRIDAIIEVGLKLPHGAEAAIRVWSAIDPEVHDVQEQVDRAALRHHVRFRHGVPGQPAAGADVRATGPSTSLVGHEQSTLPRDTVGAGLDRRAAHRRTRSGGFASAPMTG